LLLVRRKLSWRKLADLVGYTPSWLSKVKNGRPPSADLARRCDEVLGAGGKLMALAGSDTVTPAQLPAVTAGFVGRERALRELWATLRVGLRPGTPRVVAIDGPPGVGKTSLALRWAHDVAEQYPDGQLYADLRGHSDGDSQVRPGDVLGTFLAVLGVPAAEIPTDPEERAGLYRSVLAGRRMQIALDDAADFAQIEPLLPASEGCLVVVTSRARMLALAVRTHATRLTLGPMSEQESCALLAMLVGAPRADAESEALRELTRLCAYLPLALRIVGEQAITDPDLPLGNLVRDLAAEGQRLDQLSVDDAVAVRVVFSWSYRKLDGELRRLFRLLGLHPGPRISEAAAAALVDRPLGVTRQALAKLGTMHLLDQAEPGSYRFHELLRLYAVERAQTDEPAPERDAAVRRLTDWYLRMVQATHVHLGPFRQSLDTVRQRWRLPETADPFADPASAMLWCDNESANFAPITRLAAEHGLVETATRLPLLLFDYLIMRKPWPVWVATHEVALPVAREIGDSATLGWLMTHLSYACWWLGDYDRSQRLYEDAFVLHKEFGDLHGQGWSLEGMAIVAVARDDLTSAHEHATEALKLFENVGNREGQSATLGTLCDVDRGLGRSDAALAAADDSLRISQEIQDDQRTGHNLMKIAMIYLERGEHDQAMRRAELALRLYRSLKDRWGEAYALVRVGDILYEVGRPDEARQSWLAAQEMFGEMGDPRAEQVGEAIRRNGWPV
jgi:tetratricopeptide (TPR) repeat protein